MNHEGREGREGVVLGPGYFESSYKKAMHVELTAQGIAYESEKAMVVAGYFLTSMCRC